MNFLAHQYLSFGIPELRIGNFIADFIRGDMLKTFPKPVTIGIKLHRGIDRFTDIHPKVKESVILLKPRQGKYAAVVLDIYYDYFLAKNWDKFSDISLENFSQSVYTDFKNNLDVFPKSMDNVIKSIIQQDWLTNYKNEYGLSMALKNIEKRASFDNNINHALKDLKELETELEQNFLIFFPDMILMVKEFIKTINKN